MDGGAGSACLRFARERCLGKGDPIEGPANGSSMTPVDYQKSRWVYSFVRHKQGWVPEVTYEEVVTPNMNEPYSLSVSNCNGIGSMEAKCEMKTQWPATND